MGSINLGKVAATVQVGTVTTGEAATQASVTNSGTAQDVVLNFTIPRGATGEESIFDVSVYNASGTPVAPAKYASLSAALAAVPSVAQKGGMSIKYIQSSDNKYVQYRLMSQTFSTTVTDWQGVDELAGLLEHHVSVNLFNKKSALIKNGYYQSGFAENKSYHVTHPIFVRAGITYKASYAGGLGANAKIGVVDAANNMINTVTGTNINGEVYITPNTDCYLSFNIGNAVNALDTFMVCIDTEFPSSYVGYYDYYSFNAVTIPTNRLTGKSVIFAGDSICAGAGGDGKGWAQRIGDANNMSWQNKGIGGGTIIDKNLVGSAFTIAETDFDSGADYIILEGGTNDADRIGSILNGATPELFGTYDTTDYTTQFNTSTFCNAVQHLLQTVVSTYPSAHVGFIIAPKMGVTSNGYTAGVNNRRAYFETIINLCNKWGVPVLNLWDECKLNPRIASHYTQGEDYMYVDGQHLTSNGYDYITPIIQAWMETL